MSRLILSIGYVLASLIVFLSWSWQGRPQPVVDAPGGRIACMSYSPHVHGYSPFDKTIMVPRVVMEKDLAHLKAYTDCVRTYATSQGQEVIPEIAAKLGMKVLLGIWISREEADNEKEMARGIAAAKAYPDAIRAIIVGNEVMLRGEQTESALAAKARRVKAATGLPGTIADIWAFWLKHPDLAKSVDFITIHILPYWEDSPQSITQIQPLLDDIIGRVTAKFPQTKFLIGETGWPSIGRTRGEAVPSLINQARYIRGFVALATQRGWDYNLIEAYDQPWKRYLEGTVGGAWGLLHPDGSPKFPFTGPVSNNPNWLVDAIASLVLGGLGFWLYGLSTTQSACCG
ncbi:MAG: glycosyl hydrolase family 17 protein [Alphaproteobacteria bacterium]